VLGVTETEAKHHKKKKKKKGSSPLGPQCPASCPVCQECINGASCTVQSDFTPCGNAGCQVCQSGVCVNRANGTTCEGDGRCDDGTCATCADGVKNGDETDVDCGGSCDRCETAKQCTGRQDCLSGRCLNGQCTACTIDADCGTDDRGACGCQDGICHASPGRSRLVPIGPDFDPCRNCPAGTVGCEVFQAAGQVLCSPFCGATF
jgi:hypothetical protein